MRTIFCQGYKKIFSFERSAESQPYRFAYYGAEPGIYSSIFYEVIDSITHFYYLSTRNDSYHVEIYLVDLKEKY